MAISGPSRSHHHDDDEFAPTVFSEINITPLTDIFLVLLIIFMVGSSIVVEQAQGGGVGGLPGLARVRGDRRRRARHGPYFLVKRVISDEASGLEPPSTPRAICSCASSEAVAMPCTLSLNSSTLVAQRSASS